MSLSKKQKQHILNKAYAHCVAQGEPAMVWGVCCYLASDGKRCAIGAGMTDEDIGRLAESVTSISGLLQREGAITLFDVECSFVDWEFLSAIQRAHDHVGQGAIDTFETSFGTVAELYGLSMPKGEED